MKIFQWFSGTVIKIVYIFKKVLENAQQCSDFQNKKRSTKWTSQHWTFEHRLTFSAWTWVLGKPSSRKPLEHSGLFRLVSISSTTNSSDTSCPSSITFLTRLPSSDPDDTTARNMSPVAKKNSASCQTFFFLFFFFIS